MESKLSIGLIFMVIKCSEDVSRIQQVFLLQNSVTVISQDRNVEQEREPISEQQKRDSCGSLENNVRKHVL